MVKLKDAFLISTLFIAVSSEFLSDEVKDVRFTKVTNDGFEYEFEYELDNGDIFHGRALPVHRNSRFYILFGAEDQLYWVRIYSEDTPFTKTVRLVERDSEGIRFKDDYSNYIFSFISGQLSEFPYATEWNLQNICFTKDSSEQQTFDYEITSENNSRKYTGTTFYEMNDPMVQQFGVVYYGIERVYEVNFTIDELSSNESFCKGITKFVSEMTQPPPYTSPKPTEINPQLIISLTG